MNKLFTITLLVLLLAGSVHAQLPIVYYDCENNGTRTNAEVTPEMAVNSASSITFVGGTGGCATIGCPNAQGNQGAGIAIYGGTANGSSVSVGGWPLANGGVGAATYYQFNVSTAGFNNITLRFDSKYGGANAPVGLGVLISADGIAWTMVGTTAAPAGNTLPAPAGNNSWTQNTANLTTASAAIANNNSTLYIRIYGYGATNQGMAAYLSLDNVTILAGATVAGKVFTTLNEQAIYTGHTSGSTGTMFSRNSFTATGAGTNVTINATSGLSMASGQTFAVSAGATVTFGTTASISGTGGVFNISSGSTLVTANVNGIGGTGSITTTGSNVYSAGANYTFNATTATPFPTGTFGNPANVTINPGAGNTVSLNISPTITGILAFTNGNLAIGSNTLTLAGTVTGMSGTNLLTGGTGAQLNISGSGALGTLFFNQAVDGTTNAIATFNENRTGGTVTLGNKLVSGSVLNLTNGKLILNGQTLQLNGTFNGNAASTLTGSAGAILNIGGSGALGTLYFDQTLPGTSNALSALTINRTSSGQATLGNAVVVGAGSLNLINGTLADGGNIITLSGNITGTGTHTGAGKIAMVGSGSTISSASLSNLELNNAGGFSLTGSPSIGGTLTFTSGKLTLGSQNLLLGLAAAIAGTPSATAMVVANGTGQVRKLFASNGAFVFPVGDNISYTPITLDVLNGIYDVGAYIGVNLRSIKHPNNANVTDFLNRYWTVNASGITALVYKVTSATYALGDVSGTESNLSTGQYSGTLPWVRHNAANTTTHTLSSDFVLEAANDFSGISLVNPIVNSSANTTVCAGNSAVLTASGAVGDPVLTYVWSPASGLSATSGTTTTATPAATTTYTVTVRDGNGFTGTATTTVTVNTVPTITGNTSVCIGVVNTLTNSLAGGTWSSSNNAIATIATATGEVAGIAAGTAEITYTASPGCWSTIIVTVLPLPAAITGSNQVCTGNTTSLAHPVSGGTWQSSNLVSASVSSSGIVTGIAAGTSRITYTLSTGCIVSVQVSVHPVPAPIAGADNVCLGLTTTLTHPVSGGTWASADPGIASVDPGSGVLTGINAGNLQITYTVPEGCISATGFTVNPLPGSIAGDNEVCELGAVTFTNPDAGGVWSSATPGIATVNSSNGVVAGIAAGEATIVYTLPTTCSVSKILTVNALPQVITGPGSVCTGLQINLNTLSTGGAWSSNAPLVATVNASGGVAGLTSGTSNISYSFSNGCSVSTTITVNPLPANISGDMDLCVDDAVTLVCTPAGGSWSSADADVDVEAATGVVTGVADGTAIVTYTLNTGCISTALVTVHPLPSLITGIDEVCVNGTTTLFNFAGDGTWSSSTPAIATVNAATGVVAGITTGQAEIVYTLPTGCFRIAVVTVNPLPAAISGPDAICDGNTALLASTSAGGTWISSDDGIASVDGSGTVSAVDPGTVVITYTLPTGCYTARQVTINSLPQTITGTLNVCVDGTTTLFNADAGGSWSSADANVSVGSLSGIVGGLSAGTALVTYTMPTTCVAVTEVTVNPLPADITGEKEVCPGLSVVLENADGTGSWSCTSPVVTVGSATGIVAGVSAGTAVVTYTLPTGCVTTIIVTVNELPGDITGSDAVCVGQSFMGGSTPAGGTWEGNDPGTATVSPDGTVSGISAGTKLISYVLPSGCLKTKEIVVNPLPEMITGNMPLCEAQSSALGNTSPGGSWTSSSASVATVSATGVLSGVNQGFATISYTLNTGCYSIAVATVNPVPPAITGFAFVCAGSVTSLANAMNGGSWSSATPAVGTVAADGVVTGISAGTTIVTYMVETGCNVSRVVTVNPLPDPIAGVADVCIGETTVLTGAPAGGTWSSGNTTISTVHPSTGVVGGVADGNAAVTYRLPTGCTTTRSVTVNPLPEDITGTLYACDGESTTLFNAGVTGTWSTEDALIATVDADGLVSAASVGTTWIRYTLPTGCKTVAEFTVNPLPDAFTGSVQICEGTTGLIGNSYTGGTWESSAVAVAEIGSITGSITGIVAGTATVTYTLATGCKRHEDVTVNPAVPAITGATRVCAGAAVGLINPASGGTWSSADPLIATVTAAGGIVSGIQAGPVNITYTLPTGCHTAVSFTVDPLPAAITGVLQVCVGQNTALSDATTGGTWSGGAVGIANIGSTGIVNGTAAGVASITYTLATGCMRTADVVVNPLPAVQNVGGGGSYCAGGTGVAVQLMGSQTATDYKLFNGTAPVATMPGTGGILDFGPLVSAGTYTVMATATGTGCNKDMAGSAMITILPYVAPSVVLGSGSGDTLCAGTPVTFTAVPVNGGTLPLYQWLVNAVPVSAAGSSYMYTPANGDVVTVKMTSSEQCPSPAVVSMSKTMTVIANQTPAISITRTSGDTICQFADASFHALATWGGDAPAYEWRRNGVNIGSGADFTYVPADGDVITCTLTSSFRCRLVTEVASNAITMNVDSVYVPNVTITVSPALVIAPDAVATLTATVTGAGASPTFQWLLNNAEIPGATSAVLSRGFNDNDMVSCMVYGSGVCGLPSFNLVTIRTSLTADIADDFTTSHNVAISPNPTSGLLYITGTLSLKGSNTVIIEVINMMGQIVSKHVSVVADSKVSEQINLDSTLPDGVYMLRISSDDFKKISPIILKR